ncbi:hypothetical protein LCGC14_1377610 [marine sediment metagenome]|uniref:Terminase large subunit gp17-like C-terminal domain-containing protein n=1 Tax=marine sediment metagenome TaxID=412755 RepID=A0A0F9K3Y1_9ZZZZ
MDPPAYEPEWYKPNPDPNFTGDPARVYDDEATGLTLIRNRARPKQRPPEGSDWWVWLLMMGRGNGKTRTGTEWLDLMARTRCRKGQQVLLAGRTPADVRTFALKGEGGLLTHHPDIEYAPSKRELYWPNGVVGIIRSGANPEEFRGFSGEYALLEELAAWDYPQEAWSNLEFGMRERDPRICVATTPRPIKTLMSIKDAPNTVVVEGSSYENRGNLSEAWVTNVLDRYKDTRLGQQEIYGKLLDQMEDALWRLYTDKVTGLSGIDDHRVHRAIDLYRVVVGVDPQGTRAEGHETGIVVVGLGTDGHLYVLFDGSLNGSPGQWGHRVVAMYDKFKADRVIGEVNYGGELVEATLRNVRADVPFKAVNATRGKQRRAEPIAALYEQGKVHHVGTHAALEDEMTTFVPDEKRTAQNSPNRMDALVWACTHLTAGKRGGGTWGDRDRLGKGR